VKIHALSGPPEATLSRALARFESGFTYPLGESTRFSISHGEDYSCFYRAIGACRVMVAERDGEVLGTLGGAVRDLRAADGMSLVALYIGDLKVLPGIEAGLTLIRLAAALLTWARPQVTVAYGVAMDGTRKTPERYTGRFGIPAFAEVGKIMVLRFACEGARPNSVDEPTCASSEGFETFLRLTRGGYAAIGANSAERSAMGSRWLRLESGAACGMLEDTREAKRLFEVGGEELRSAHLSHFAFQDLGSGAALLKRAAALAARLKFPALFCAVPSVRAAALVDALGSPAPTLAPATVYGAGLASGSAWHINTAEI
jgi:hypothetical protein